MSPFHEKNGIYAEGVHIDTAVLPDGCRNRLVRWELQSSEPAKPRFLEPHDLAISKLAAGRPKDHDFVLALIRGRLLDVAVLQKRASMLPAGTDPRVCERIEAWLHYHCTDNRNQQL
jgi:hypothetical protein